MYSSNDFKFNKKQAHTTPKKKKHLKKYCQNTESKRQKQGTNR